MTRHAAECPNCGAPIVFSWSSAVQSVCEHCRSIVVRHDVDLTRVGVVADLPPDPSPIRIGTQGRYRDRAFNVVGRILYEYDEGFWNEWYLTFDGNTDGWLSDAQLEYAVTRAVEGAVRLPPAEDLQPDREVLILDRVYKVTTRTLARYRGVEGQLPFESWQRQDVLLDSLFVDLRTVDRDFATIDFSDGVPAIYVGEFVEFDELSLRDLKEFDGWARPS